MGNARPRPGRLAEKLQQIRIALGLSQPEMLKRLGLEDSMQYARISEYETGLREPTLMTLLQYARVAGVNMEVLADDGLDLPGHLPGATDHAEIRRRFSRARKSKR